MEELRVPLARAPSGRLATPEEARKLPPAELSGLQCAECSAPVVLRIGSRVRSHFAHAAGAACALTGETSRHLAGKLRACDFAGSRVILHHRDQRKILLLRGTVARQEFRLSGSQALVADVAFLNGDGTVALIVEVCEAHPVDAAKATALDALGIPWVEVSAKALTKDGRVWFPYQFGNVEGWKNLRKEPRQSSRPQTWREWLIGLLGVKSE